MIIKAVKLTDVLKIRIQKVFSNKNQPQSHIGHIWFVLGYQIQKQTHLKWINGNLGKKYVH